MAEGDQEAVSLTRSLEDARENYSRGGLAEADLLAEPVVMFQQWYADARDAGIGEPNAMVLATASAQGAPSARIVLLKGVSSEGFVFYTNIASRKGSELASNPRCSLLFPWHPLERQVRVEGSVSLLPRAAVEDYFAVRPRGSQLGAWASHQSRVVAGPEALRSSYDEIQARFAGADVPVPDEWGGYLVRPEVVEFWQGRPSRMHDRLVYRRVGHGSDWDVARLAP